MQILESSSWGLRSARISLKHPSGGKVITLFPMVHIGEPEFYQTVYHDAFSQDVVLVEGIDSPIVQQITRSYRWIKGSKISDLVLQTRYPRQIGCNAKIVPADLSASEFRDAWRVVPLWLRAAVFVIAPIRGLQLRAKTREQIAKGLSLDDAMSQDELVSWSPEAGMLYRAILDIRDERLVDNLDVALANNEESRVAIVYGARHMRAVLRHLINVKSYVCVDSEWLTVFGF